jgi:hypothetical protein
VVGEAVEERRGHLGVAEDGRPFTEGEVGGDDDGGLLVETADEVEEQLTTGLGEGKVAEFIENDEVQAAEVVGNAALSAGPGLGLELVDEVDDIEEPPAGAAADAGAGYADGEMGLACPGAADEDQVALLGEEAAAGEVTDQGLVDRGAVEDELFDVLGQRQLGDGDLVFDERACFSESSAVSRSLTTRCGSCCRFTAVAMTSS